MVSPIFFQEFFFEGKGSETSKLGFFWILLSTYNQFSTQIHIQCFRNPPILITGSILGCNLKPLETYSVMKNHLVMKKRLLILYKNTHYIIPCKKNCFFLNVIFLSIETLQFLFHVRGRRPLIYTRNSKRHNSIMYGLWRSYWVNS